jgi:hypothetical protein
MSHQRPTEAQLAELRRLCEEMANPNGWDRAILMPLALAVPGLLAEVERLRGEAEEWRALAVDSSGRHGEAAGLLSRLADAVLDDESYRAHTTGPASQVLCDALSAARAHLGRGEAKPADLDTEPRQPGCECHQEQGDSECPMHPTCEDCGCELPHHYFGCAILDGTRADAVAGEETKR